MLALSWTSFCQNLADQHKTHIIASVRGDGFIVGWQVLHPDGERSATITTQREVVEYLRTMWKLQGKEVTF